MPKALHWFSFVWLPYGAHHLIPPGYLDMISLAMPTSISFLRLISSLYLPDPISSLKSLRSLQFHFPCLALFLAAQRTSVCLLGVPSPRSCFVHNLPSSRTLPLQMWQICVFMKITVLHYGTSQSPIFPHSAPIQSPCLDSTWPNPIVKGKEACIPVYV
jgi:hypothetical protein